MNVKNSMPQARYEWQQSYLAAALETDSRLLPGKIEKARRDIRLRLFDCIAVEAEEQGAIAQALNGLAALERERLHIAANVTKSAIMILDWKENRNEPNAA